MGALRAGSSGGGRGARGGEAVPAAAPRLLRPQQDPPRRPHALRGAPYARAPARRGARRPGRGQSPPRRLPRVRPYRPRTNAAATHLAERGPRGVLGQHEDQGARDRVRPPDRGPHLHAAHEGLVSAGNAVPRRTLVGRLQRRRPVVGLLRGVVGARALPGARLAGTPGAAEPARHPDRAGARRDRREPRDPGGSRRAPEGGQGVRRAPLAAVPQAPARADRGSGARQALAACRGRRSWRCGAASC